jgi:S1-C subfamily serine protease
MVLLQPEFLECVVAIGTIKEEWYGTGFFYEYIKDERHIFLVTNKHVIESQIKDNKTQIRIKLNSKSDDPIKTYDVDLFDEEDRQIVIYHPNKDVDLAIIPFDFYNMVKEVGMHKVRFFSQPNACKKNQMKTLGISEGDSVFILGFPMANVHIKSNVIVRSGIIARIRDIYNDNSESYLLDSFIFPGNSGGPVFLVPQSVSILGTTPIIQSQLIGVVKEYLAYEDIARSENTGEPRVIFTENSGLTLVHPIDYVDEIIKIYLNHNRS